MEEILKIEGVCASYGKRQILHDISLNMSRGEKVLLIGPNGSGKTTLLKTIMGLLAPQKGQILFGGKDLNGVSVRARIAKGIGYLLQTKNIVPGLTVEENLALGGYYLSKEEFEKNMERVLDPMGFLKPKLKSRAGLLSGGERQALALSMVLMKKPRLLLLDEPSAGLAPKAAKRVIENLDTIQESFQVETICMVEHNLKLALEWTNKVAVLVQGHIVLITETPQTFIQSPKDLEKYFFELEHPRNSY